MERGWGVLNEVLEHLGCGVDEHFKQFGIRSSAIDNTVDVGECRFPGIGNARFGHDVVIGQPNATAGNGGGTPEEFVFFNNQNLCAFIGGHGRRNKGSAT
ncbi:unannotated protein [freshwater metagenome]|uniref:Unannotated protein n=1 Tax=freshwater metagenome TaxID=449393 RepID=A0A6J7MGX9_9ZZZZ